MPSFTAVAQNPGLGRPASSRISGRASQTPQQQYDFWMTIRGHFLARVFSVYHRLSEFKVFAFQNLNILKIGKTCENIDEQVFCCGNSTESKTRMV